MRLALPLALALAGCVQPTSDPPPPPDPGWTGPGGSPISGCVADSECAPLACARDGNCYAASTIHFVHTAWTIQGGDADVMSCGDHPNLDITFWRDDDESLGYSPVPCRNGEYTIDKLPTRYTQVELRYVDTPGKAYGVIDDDGEATIDLP